ncbi:MAG: hypothetical protein HKN68_00440 [Saprospiraceae bacterium]|nr:hypothetical protein [Saprospiraceae bacterium]
MKQSTILYYLFILMCITLSISCEEQGVKALSKQVGNENTILNNTPEIRETIPNIKFIRCAIIDHDGDLWFGTNNNGVFSYDGKSFTNYTTQDGLISNHVISILEDRNGNLYFGTRDGLSKYDRVEFSQINIPWVDTSSTWLDEVYPVVNPNEVRSMIQGKDGIFWLGTNGAGAYRYDPDAVKDGGIEFTSFLSNEGRKQSDSLYHNIISSITEDEEGNIWFTSMTHGGLSRYDGTRMTHFEMEAGLSDDMVFSSFLDSSGDLWFGSLGNRNGGLDRFNTSIEGQNNDTKIFTNFNEADGLCNTNVVCLYEDKRGYLWLGSQRGEMCIYDGETFSPFTTREGKTFHGITFIKGDKKGNIYFGGMDGQLFHYDLSAEHEGFDALTDYSNH